MSADENDRFIQYLVDKINTYELDKLAKARKLDKQLKDARKNKGLIINTRNDIALQSALNQTCDLNRILTLHRQNKYIFSKNGGMI